MKRMLLTSLFFTVVAFSAKTQTQQKYWWKLAPTGGIIWNVKVNEIHTDHIEMSGKQISAIVTYGVDAAGKLVLNKRIIFPLLRTIPNDTRGSLWKNFTEVALPIISVNDERLEEFPESFQHNKLMSIVTRTKQRVRIERTIYPSVDKAAYIEKYRLTNTTSQRLNVNVAEQDETFRTDSTKGVYGIYQINYKTHNHGLKTLGPGETDEFSVVFSARKDKDPANHISSTYEMAKRKQFVAELNESLVLKTPDLVLNTFYAFAKLRATESIYETKGGLMHSPGGANYYAALWANDEGEFTSPLFPFIGNATGIESAINCYRTFATYMNPEYERLPSSIVAEGTSTWNWKETKYGDRGDAAMLLYGGTRFAIAYADTLEAKRMWPLLTWCAEYTLRRKNADGVIASETDGEEGRFKTGKANLYVNALAYGGLVMASRLAKQLNLSAKEIEFNTAAKQLRENIGKYFQTDILGYATYKYHKDATTLYAWAGMPLAMGIFDRAPKTQQALFSKDMWAKNVMLSESGNTKRYFERPMLNSFRGLFYSGYQIDTTLKYFKAYTASRLLGEHVPYVVEAYPEGNGRQLAGDNALYCRIMTEGLFGIEPVAFNKFNISPRLPEKWNEMSLKHLKAFNGDFEILATRQAKKIMVKVTNKGKLVKQLLWDGIKPIEVVL